MTYFDELVSTYSLPHAYQKRETRVAFEIPRLFVLPPGTTMSKLTRSYSRAKHAAGEQFDSPRDVRGFLRSKRRFEQFSYEHSTYLSESVKFDKLGTIADESIKPILLYYSTIMLFSFLSESIFWFNNPKRNHGLSLDAEQEVSPSSCKLTVWPSGMFARVVDTYTLLGGQTEFSPFSVIGSGRAEPTNNESSYLKPRDFHSNMSSIFTIPGRQHTIPNTPTSALS